MKTKSKILTICLLVAAIGCVVWFANKTKIASKISGEKTGQDDVLTVYNKNCAQCHRSDLGGDLGPNLTDDFWIYGHTLKDVEKSIAVGTPDRGMPGYNEKLSSSQIRDLALLIKSRQGSNPPKPKAPQGYGVKLTE